MKYKWNENGVEGFEGVTQQLSCEGEMLMLEIQVQDDGTVVGVALREIPATFWEPADWMTLIEEVYPSVDAAKAALEKYDDDLATAEQEADRLCEEYHKFLEQN